jgi:SHAQKYF class myb-like DNA-binding protein
MKLKRLGKEMMYKGLNVGSWKSEEHKKFLEGMEIYGRDWKKVSTHVKTRNTAQCRSHAQKYFIKLERLREATDDGYFMSTSTLATLDEYLNSLSNKCNTGVQYGEGIEFHTS